MFEGGAASSQEAYILARSGDGGATWKAVSSRRYPLPALTGYGAVLRSVRVHGNDVTIAARGRSATIHA